MASATTRRCIEPSASDTVTGNSETAHAKTLLIPAGTLRKHVKLRVGFAAKHTVTASTDTSRQRVYLGTAANATGLLLLDTGAVDPANDDVAGGTGEFEVKTFGGASTGVLVGSGVSTGKSGGTAYPTTVDATEAQLDFTADLYLTVTSVQSQATGNTDRLDSLWFEACQLEQG